MFIPFTTETSLKHLIALKYDFWLENVYEIVEN